MFVGPTTLPRKGHHYWQRCPGLSVLDERYLHITSASTSTSIQDRLQLWVALVAAAGTDQQHCGIPHHISAAHVLSAQICIFITAAAGALPALVAGGRASG